MSYTQVDLDKSTIFGSGEINRVRLPQLTAHIRRKNPDMSSTVPYYPSLSGKTLILEIGGDVTSTTTVTFTSNSYSQALADISAAGSGDFTGEDFNGFLTVRSTHAGNKNFIKINGGNSLSILGFEAYPHPTGISYAGEIASAYPTTYENRTKGETVILQNEAINRENWNRGLAGVGYILDTMLNNLDKEIAVPKEYDVTINGSSFSISSSDRLFINTSNLLVSQPSADQIDNVVCILDQFHNQIFDSNGNRVRVNSITYGTLVDETQSFSSWGTADGKSVFGSLSHFQKAKGSYTISSIYGNTVRITGGNLSTDKVLPNDTIVISGATNITPFSHNGEFIVDKVLASDLLQIRPKGTSDFNLFGTNTPSSLNPVLNLGEVYGTITAYVGKFLPLTMKSGNMVFNLSSSLPSDSYKVRIATGRTLKQLLQDDLSASEVISPYGGQLEIGSKLISTLANALKPRIISKPNGSVDKTLFGEFFSNTTMGAVGLRVYTDRSGGIEFVYNGKWDGTSFNKDDAGQDTVFIKEDGTAIFMGDSTFSINLNHVSNTLTAGSSTNQFKVDNGAGTLTAKISANFNIDDASNTIVSVPDFDGLITSQIVAKPGIKLGTGYTSDSQSLIEKINYTANTGSGKYTLLTETTLAGARRREYVLDTGYRADTFNCKWNGTQWVRDSGSIPAIKSVVNNEGHLEYIYTGASNPFADTSWTGVNDFKNYQLNEDFLTMSGGIMGLGVGDKVGPIFTVDSASNATSSPAATPSGFGEVAIAGTSATSFSAHLSSTELNFGTADFVLILKAKCLFKNKLETVDISNPFNAGFFVGLLGSGAQSLGIITGSDLSTWYVGVDGSGIDTLVTNNSTPITVMFKKYGTTLNTYVNKVLLDSRNYTTSNTYAKATIAVSGIATMGFQDIVTIDTVKLWYAENNYA